MSFSLNVAKSYIGKTVNIHLKDGAVIVNVQLKAIKTVGLSKTKLFEYAPFGNVSRQVVPIKNIAYTTTLNRSILNMRN
ncbi:MAG: hypothetical protein LBE76_02375 [Nitrososphaerota archaeon]|nr:hypothetical protein [Nitrososphaerota archaeon]